MSRALEDVATERETQRDLWGDEHDDRHTDGLLANLAADHIMRPRTDRRRQLVIATALLVAEIERLDRMEAREGREETDHE